MNCDYTRMAEVAALDGGDERRDGDDGVVVLLWGCRSARLLLLVSLLLLLLHEVELVVPLAVQTFPLSLFTLTFPLPLTLFTVCPGLLPRSRSRRDSLPVGIRSSAGMTPGPVIHPFVAFNTPLALT
jgi:hypothetical protein